LPDPSIYPRALLEARNCFPVRHAMNCAFISNAKSWPLRINNFHA
jgi:hypothetical protein